MHESFVKWRGEPTSVCHGAHERRADARHVAVRWLARIESDEASELCVVHNICATALIAEIFAPRILGESVRVVISDRQALAGTVVWANETNAEVRFAQPIDVSELIEAREATSTDLPPPPPRLEISCQGWLELGDETVMVEVCDLSQGGARLAADVTPTVGQRALLVIQGLTAVAGEVRWWEEGRLGVAFDQPIPFDTLTGWIVARDTQAGLHGQSRRWPRYSILLKTAARLMDVAQPVDAIVHNISRGGVLISCRRGLHCGDHVELGLGPAGHVAGRVVWVSDGNAGIEFNRTIDTEHVLHPLGERAVPPVLHHYVTGRRPGLNSHKGHSPAA